MLYQQHILALVLSLLPAACSAELDQICRYQGVRHSSRPHSPRSSHVDAATNRATTTELANGIAPSEHPHVGGWRVRPRVVSTPRMIGHDPPGFERCWGPSTGSRAGALLYGEREPNREAIVGPGPNVQTVGVLGRYDRIVDGRHGQPKELQRLADLDAGCVRNVEHVLVPHRELGCQEIALGIAQIHVIDHRNNRSRKPGTVDAETLGHLADFAPIQENSGRLGEAVVQSAGLSYALRERNSPSVESELSLPSGLYHRSAGGRHDGPKCEEGLRLAIEVNGISGMRPDIVRRFINQRPEWRGGAAPPPIQHHTGSVTPPPRAARARNRIEDVLSRVIGWESTSIIDLT